MPLSLKPRSKGQTSDSAVQTNLETPGTHLHGPLQSAAEKYIDEGSVLSQTSSYSSFSELESNATTLRKKDNSLSRSNSMSAKLKGLFHRSPQNSSLHLPLNHHKSPITPDRGMSPKLELDRLDISASSHAMNNEFPTSVANSSRSGSSPSPPAKTPAGSPVLPNQAVSKPELNHSASNSDLNGSMSKLKLQMPPVIENDLDEVLALAETERTSNGIEPSSTHDELKQSNRGRNVLINSLSNSGSLEQPLSSRSRSTSRQRDLLKIGKPSALPKEVTDKLKNFKHHKEGNLVIFDEGSLPHLHDFSKLRKEPIQTSPSGILGSLLGVKKREVTQQDHLLDLKLESSLSLLPDNYSEELISFKSKPENFRFNYEDYLYGDNSSGSEYESDSDYDSDEDIDPIIGTTQLDIINKLVDKIEHLDKYKERIVTAKKLKLIEKYGKIQGVVGKGSYGTVKLAVKQLPNKSQRIFAIKELKQKSNENLHHFSNRVTSEFMISSSLTHQSIINTYDLMVDFGSHIFLQVMEYVPCGDLFTLVQSSNGEGLQSIEADCFFKQTLNAISYLHSVGISHNDIKVENLLLTLTGQLKIIDFGTSTPIKCSWETRCSKLSGPQGSEPYCGPEMFSKKDYDPRLLDIWSLGVVYLVMANGGYGWKIADPKIDSAYNYYLESRPQEVGAKGSYESIENLSGNNKASKRRVLYAMMNPNPDKRIKLKEIWKSKWVSGIELCDAGKGLDPVVY